MESKPAEGNAIPLFRSEAIRFQAARLEGEVMLKIRSPWLLLGSVSACLVLITVITACFTTYTTRARVAGIVVSTAASAAIASDREGVVSEVYVRDGDEVGAGAPLMRMRSIERAGPPGVRASTAGACVPDTRVAVAAGSEPHSDSAPAECVLRATVDSVVTAVRVSGGQPFATGSVLARLAPKLARLEAELAVPARVVAHLETGQQVVVRYDAFPYSEFGAARGTIISVDPMPSQDVNGMSQVPSHRVRVSLDHQFVSAAGRQIPLGPGMSLSADIILGERSFLDWLFEPSQTMAAST